MGIGCTIRTTDSRAEEFEHSIPLFHCPPGLASNTWDNIQGFLREPAEKNSTVCVCVLKCSADGSTNLLASLLGGRTQEPQRTPFQSFCFTAISEMGKTLQEPLVQIREVPASLLSLLCLSKVLEG